MEEGAWDQTVIQISFALPEGYLPAGLWRLNNFFCKAHDAVIVQLTHDFVIIYRGAAREMAVGPEEFR